ncbi:MAG TPA: SAV_2336 N-terminal domain-related protein [Mycobacteriales bacterium]|nr:SAV_2336 N-terminal domain-related protein [Mycobacteriales bacterium]
MTLTDRVAGALRAAGLAAVSPNEIEDVLLLASRMPLTPMPARSDRPRSFPAPAVLAPPAVPDETSGSGPHGVTSPAPRVAMRLAARRTGPAWIGQATTVMPMIPVEAVPHRPAGLAGSGLPSMLENPLGAGRALRPFQIRRPALERTELDDVLTAERAARLRRWEPVLRSPLARWPDLALVLDVSPTVGLWTETVHDLELLLGRLGAFREMRTWRLHPPVEDGAALLTAGLGQRLGQVREATSLADPTGRRLILVVTDGAGPQWCGPYQSLLSTWSATNQVAVISMVPPWLWPRDGLRARKGQVRVSQPLQPNARWTQDGTTGQSAPPVPVVDLRPRLLERLGALARGSSQWVNTLLVDTPPRAEGGDGQVTEPMPVEPDRVVSRLRGTLEPRAFELLMLLSAGVLDERVISWIRRHLLPQATTADVYEVLHSGILEPVPQPDGVTGQIAAVYRFRDDDVRAELMGRLNRSVRTGIHRQLLQNADEIGINPDVLQLSLDDPDSTEILIRLAIASSSVDILRGVDREQIERFVRTELVQPDRHHAGSRIVAVTAKAVPRRTAAARLLAELCREHGLLASDQVEAVAARVLFVGEPGAGAAELTSAVLQRSADGLLAIDGTAELDPRDRDCRQAVRALLAAVASADAPMIVFADRSGQVEALRSRFPELAERLPAARILNLPATAVEDAYVVLLGYLPGLRWTPPAQRACWAVLARHLRDHPETTNVEPAARATAAAVISRWQRRVHGDRNQPLTAADVPGSVSLALAEGFAP